MNSSWTSLIVFVMTARALAACTGTIASLDDVAAAVKCTTVNINSFTVPAGKTFDISLLAGTTVNMRMSYSYHSHPGFELIRP
jgi:polygalacturonase